MTEARGNGSPDGETCTRHTPGTPCWVSLMVHEPDTIQSFYGALFGWAFRPGQPGAYVHCLLKGQPVASIGALPPDRRRPVAWTPYFASDDVDLTAHAVRACGGTIGVGPLEAPDSGRLAIGSDPCGAVFGIWGASSRTGPAVTGVPGTVAWSELTTYEPSQVATFYGTVFGHEDRTDSPAQDCVTLHLSGRPVAGVRGLGTALARTEGPRWTTYFTVTDVDDAADRVLRLGGQILEPPHDADRGRVAVVTDPEGARFAMVEGSR